MRHPRLAATPRDSTQPSCGKQGTAASRIWSRMQCPHRSLSWHWQQGTLRRRRKQRCGLDGRRYDAPLSTPTPRDAARPPGGADTVSATGWSSGRHHALIAVCHRNHGSGLSSDDGSGDVAMGAAAQEAGPLVRRPRFAATPRYTTLSPGGNPCAAVLLTLFPCHRLSRRWRGGMSLRRRQDRRRGRDDSRYDAPVSRPPPPRDARDTGGATIARVAPLLPQTCHEATRGTCSPGGGALAIPRHAGDAGMPLSSIVSQTPSCCISGQR